jgi:kinetochore protein Spc24
MRTLGAQQSSVGKQLNEEKSGMAKKEAELGRWRGEKEEVGKREVGEEDWVDGKM